MKKRSQMQIIEDAKKARKLLKSGMSMADITNELGLSKYQLGYSLEKDAGKYYKHEPKTRILTEATYSKNGLPEIKLGEVECLKFNKREFLFKLSNAQILSLTPCTLQCDIDDELIYVIVDEEKCIGKIQKWIVSQIDTQNRITIIRKEGKVQTIKLFAMYRLFGDVITQLIIDEIEKKIERKI